MNKIDSESLKSLAINFNEMGLCDAAIDWLLDFYMILQGLDDVADGDECDWQDLIVRLLITMPRNSWYQAYAAVLAPLIATTALKWFAANRLEAEGEELHKAYMWRAGFYDVALFVASLHGPVLKPEVFAKLYGESYEDYAKEFKNE